MCEDKDHLFSFEYYDFYLNKPNEFNEYKDILKSLGLVEDISIVPFRPEKGGQESLLTLVFVHFKVNGKELKFDSLSDGTKRVVRLLFYFFYKKTTLTLIEEPETSIHWGLLAQLLSVLNQYVDNDKKMLFSTHSEQVLNQLKPEQIIYMDNIDGNTKTKYLTGESLKRVQKHLTEVGPLGEYATSGGLEEDIND